MNYADIVIEGNLEDGLFTIKKNRFGAEKGSIGYPEVIKLFHGDKKVLVINSEGKTMGKNW